MCVCVCVCVCVHLCVHVAIVIVQLVFMHNLMLEILIIQSLMFCSCSRTKMVKYYSRKRPFEMLKARAVIISTYRRNNVF